MKYVSITVICISCLLPMGRNWKKNTCVLCGNLFYNQRIVSTLHSMNEDLEDILLLFYKQYISLDPKTHKLSLSPLFKSLNSEYIFILDGILNESQHLTWVGKYIVVVQNTFGRCDVQLSKLLEAVENIVEAADGVGPNRFQFGWIQGHIGPIYCHGPTAMLL